MADGGEEWVRDWPLERTGTTAAVHKEAVAAVAEGDGTRAFPSHSECFRQSALARS